MEKLEEFLWRLLAKSLGAVKPQNSITPSLTFCITVITPSAVGRQITSDMKWRFTALAIKCFDTKGKSW
jgi:hypothetical protein